MKRIRLTVIMALIAVLGLSVAAIIASIKNVRATANNRSEDMATQGTIIAPRSGDELLTPEEIYTRCSPAVITIMTDDEDGNPIATGSGFIISPDGAFVTNYHVMHDAEIITAKLSDGRELAVSAFLTARPFRDIIVLKLPNGIYPHLNFADATPSVGAKVYTIGSPQGLSNTLADGLVSGVRDAGSPWERVQISAPISHGSSGGPAIDKLGRVVGMTTSFIPGAENLNFAISSAAIKDLLRDRSMQPKPLDRAPFWWIAKATAQLNRINNKADRIETEQTLAIAYARSGDIASAISLLEKLAADDSADYSARKVRDEIALSLAETVDPEEGLKFLEIPLPIHHFRSPPENLAKRLQNSYVELSKISPDVYLGLTISAVAHNRISLAKRICGMIEPGFAHDQANNAIIHAKEVVIARGIVDENSERWESRVNNLSIEEQSQVWSELATQSARGWYDADLDNALANLEAISIKLTQDVNIDSRAACNIWLNTCLQSHHLERISQARSLFAIAIQNHAKKTRKSDGMAYGALQIMRSGDKEMALQIINALLKIEPLEKQDDLTLVEIAIIQELTANAEGFNQTALLLRTRYKYGSKIEKTNFMAFYPLQILHSGDEKMALELVKTLLKLKPLESYDSWELMNIAIIQGKAGENLGYNEAISLLETRGEMDGYFVIEVAGAVGDLPRLNKAFATSNIGYEQATANIAELNKALASKRADSVPDPTTSMNTIILANATEALVDNDRWDDLAGWVFDLDTPAKQAIAQANIASKIAEQMNQQ